jgi:hypothetical protein
VVCNHLEAHGHKVLSRCDTAHRGIDIITATVPVVTSAFRTAHWVTLLGLARQFVEQGFGIFQVGGVEAFGEPVEDFGEHRARFIAAVGVAKQSR